MTNNTGGQQPYQSPYSASDQGFEPATQQFDQQYSATQLLGQEPYGAQSSGFSGKTLGLIFAALLLTLGIAGGVGWYLWDKSTGEDPQPEPPVVTTSEKPTPAKKTTEQRTSTSKRPQTPQPTKVPSSSEPKDITGRVL